MLLLLALHLPEEVAVEDHQFRVVVQLDVLLLPLDLEARADVVEVADLDALVADQLPLGHLVEVHLLPHLAFDQLLFGEPQVEVVAVAAVAALELVYLATEVLVEAYPPTEVVVGVAAFSPGPTVKLQMEKQFCIKKTT